jgi:hypothetical protein
MIESYTFRWDETNKEKPDAATPEPLRTQKLRGQRGKEEGTNERELG